MEMNFVLFEKRNEIFKRCMGEIKFLTAKGRLDDCNTLFWDTFIGRAVEVFFQSHGALTFWRRIFFFKF
jgi:hypothetical protein